jgi:hypothetical protein
MFRRGVGLLHLRANLVKTLHGECGVSARARESLRRSMIAVEVRGWRGATKAHTPGM